MKMPRSINIGELVALPKPPPQVKFNAKEGVIWIRGSYPYPIEASRIHDARDIVAWVRHLSGKTWATRKLIREFVEVVASIKGINTRISK